MLLVLLLHNGAGEKEVLGCQAMGLESPFRGGSCSVVVGLSVASETSILPEVVWKWT